MPFGVRRLQYRWDCWFGDREMLRAALAAFDARIADPADGGPAVEATSSERGRREPRNGAWDAVLADTDVTALDRFSVKVPASRRATQGDFTLEFSRDDGVVLRAGSGSGDQIQRAAATLAPAIEPGVPKWSWIHSEVAELVAAVILGIVVELIWLVASNHIGNPDLLDFLPLPLGILVAFAVLTVVHRSIPRLRVTEVAGGPAAGPSGF